MMIQFGSLASRRKVCVQMPETANRAALGLEMTLRLTAGVDYSAFEQRLGEWAGLICGEC
jgi:hypothetical protein